MGTNVVAVDALLKSGMVGGPPDIINFLLQEYREAMTTKNTGLEQANGGQIDIEGELAKAGGFANFARTYLQLNRPARITHADANYGIILTNTKGFVIAPATIGGSAAMPQGMTVPSHAVYASGGDTFQELRQSGVMIPGAPPAVRPIDGVLNDRRSGTQSLIDATLPQPVKDMTK